MPSGSPLRNCLLGSNVPVIRAERPTRKNPLQAIDRFLARSCRRFSLSPLKGGWNGSHSVRKLMRVLVAHRKKSSGMNMSSHLSDRGKLRIASRLYRRSRPPHKDLYTLVQDPVSEIAYPRSASSLGCVHRRRAAKELAARDADSSGAGDDDFRDGAGIGYFGRVGTSDSFPRKPQARHKRWWSATSATSEYMA